MKTCDFCNQRPVDSDYGACATCAAEHAAERLGGPTVEVQRRDGTWARLTPGTAAYNRALDAAAAEAERRR